MLGNPPGNVVAVALSASDGGTGTQATSTTQVTVTATASSSPSSCPKSDKICTTTTVGAAVGASLGAGLLGALALFGMERRRRIRAEKHSTAVHTSPTNNVAEPASFSQPEKQGRYQQIPHELGPHNQIYEADSPMAVSNK
ncbi:hypothetical protein LTR10_021157 [Elasticomyces elasticus]|nr:hypothetical protein LTR10_021157 [Elasticomyces elasticus]